MYRRRHRRPREIAFSLDSFLDLVANVVGIIIRLILVAWVGARSYKAVINTPLPASAPTTPVARKDADDPAKKDLDRNRKELQDTQDRLLAQMRRLQELHAGTEESGKQLALLTTQHQELEKERGGLERALKEQTRSSAAVSASLEDLRKRREKLDEEIRALEKLPSAKRVLRYRTPVSRPVHIEELHFECRAGRVTFLDVAAFMAEIGDSFRTKGEALRTQWQVEAVTSQIGPFRLRYTIERKRSALDAALGGAPGSEGDYSFGVTGWVVEPLAVERGEAADAAMAPTSAFRQIVDALAPEQSVVTFWVYSDSFPIYRRLRDYLYERGIEVAGRPLPIGQPIASSRRGTVSRGQ
jgi:hypothetical protein